MSAQVNSIKFQLIDTHRDGLVISEHKTHRKAFNASNKLEPVNMHAANWRYQIRAVAGVAVEFTPAEARTIAQHGEKECLVAFAQNEVAGEGPSTIGRGDIRLGDNLINAGRKIAERDGINVRTHRDYRI